MKLDSGILTFLPGPSKNVKPSFSKKGFERRRSATPGHNEIDRQRNRSNSRGHLHNTLIGDVVETQNQRHVNNIHETQQIDMSFLDEPTFLPSQRQQLNQLPSISMMTQTLSTSHFNQLSSLNNSFYN